MKLLTSKAVVEAPEPGRRERQRLAREARSQEAMDAANKRAALGRQRTIADRIKEAQEVLNRPIGQARPVLDTLSPADLDLYLLAEELGQNRKGVLQNLPPASRSLREAYEREVGPEAPSATS